MTRELSIFLMLVVPLSAAEPDAAAWAVPGAPYRAAVHAVSQPGMPEAGWEIRLPEFAACRPDMRDVVLLDDENKEIALDGVWMSPGRSILMLAEKMPPAENPATLYFGGKTSRAMKTWSARRSLLLETRRMPPGARITSHEGWRAAWNQSRESDGAAFVPVIYHGGNPFGAESRYLSRYTGLLKTGTGGEMTFYSLSDDVAYVTVNGNPILKWLDKSPPPRDPAKVPTAAARVPEGFCEVAYDHACVDPPGAMVLGWEQNEKLGTIPTEAWVHPGQVEIGKFESSDGTPVPAASVEALEYLGFGDQWYVKVKCAVPDPGEDWKVEWLWPDGHTSDGPQCQRIRMNLDPVRVMLRMTRNKRVIESKRVLVIPREIPAASVNNHAQRGTFLELLEKEDLRRLDEPALKAGFILTRPFLPPSAAARWANAWLAKNPKPAEGAWASALAVSIRAQSLKDPKAALARIGKLGKEERAALGREADLLEMDLRVFDLKDPAVAGLVSRLSKGGDKELARIATIRMGDCHLLAGRMDDAKRCFNEASPETDESARKAPVLDRSHSLALEELIRGQHLDEARARLAAWELARPMAKIEGDQLLWRARVTGLAGDWKRALQDLELIPVVRPGAPEEIDVRFWLGRAQYELGRKDEARTVWKELIKDHPKHDLAEAAKTWAEKP